MKGQAIRVRGTVQGVGFRPFVWHLAQALGLVGSVWNDDDGVMIHAFGKQSQLDALVTGLVQQKPPLAVIAAIECQTLTRPPATDKFSITQTQSRNHAHTAISPDTAVCPACLAEMADPDNRRYAYAFTNCTHCGPRLSIINRLPYDRCHTSMDEFALCPDCLSEFQNPADRRYHAQATCCPACGPDLWLENSLAKKLQTEDVIATAVSLLKQGQILAIKGLGGFHLACLANNETAVQRLRERKRRYAKPFALMARDADVIQRYAMVSEAERSLLHSQAAPVVLLTAQGLALAPSVAQSELRLGFMLPYTPLHVLLLAHFAEPLVMTSGNFSDEPQVIDNAQARHTLSQIADALLLHNRSITNRLDDSVVQVLAGQTQSLRRARGYSPQTIKLPDGFADYPPILAMGAELKNSFCLLQNAEAIVSEHIGDLENVAVQRDYRHKLQLYQNLFGSSVKTIAVDLHPGYLSTQLGLELAAAKHIQAIPVQHHHAHICSTMLEHGLPRHTPKVLGIVFDGLGMGLNQELWGGEFLLADYQSFTRLGHFQAIALPGASQAMREPWRNLYAQLQHYFTWDYLQSQYGNCEFMQLLNTKPLGLIKQMLNKNLNAPLSSSCGRWFDAFAAVLGLHADTIFYEGQAAIALERLATPVFEHTQAYPDCFSQQPVNGIISIFWQNLWQAVIDDIQHGVDKSVIAARIHHSLADTTGQISLELSLKTNTQTIVLSGGVFQNRLLLAALTKQLTTAGKTVLSPQRYPMNDGGLALGQAVIAAAQY